MLGLLAVLHPEQVDPVDHGLLPGCRDAEELALVGAGVGHSGGHQLALGDHLVDLDPHLRGGLLDHAEELSGLLGALAAEGVVDPVGGQQLLEGGQVPAVDHVLRATAPVGEQLAPAWLDAPHRMSGSVSKQ
jgi:hypothetical protein